MAEPLKRRLPDSRFRQTRTAETRTGRQPPSRQSLWYALYIPALDNHPSTDTDTSTNEQHRKLTDIAAQCQRVSDHVSLLPPATIVFEVRSSLRYFNGIEKLRRQLVQHLPLVAQEAGHAVSPTPAASALLARSGSNRLVYRRANLRSALGALPLELLPVSERKKKRLRQSGLHSLRDIWRLPTAALRQRMGRDFVDHLQCCLGERPEPLPRWQAPPRFHQHRESDWPLESLEHLLPLLSELLENLQAFLHKRALATEHIQVRLHYDRRNESHDDSLINISLRQVAHKSAHLLMLLETRLDNQPLPAPVLGVTLTVEHFRDFVPQTVSTGLQVETASAGSKLNALLDQLETRIGRRAIRVVQAHPQWCPEDASQTHSNEATQGSLPSDRNAAFQQLPQRPGWLIMPPQPLSMRDGKPCHRGMLSLLSGPERVETRWWSGVPVQRDYYVAQNPHGMRLWIFAERRNRQTLCWFLQGLFA